VLLSIELSFMRRKDCFYISCCQKPTRNETRGSARKDSDNPTVRPIRRPPTPTAPPVRWIVLRNPPPGHERRQIRRLASQARGLSIPDLQHRRRGEKEERSVILDFCGGGARSVGPDEHRRFWCDTVRGYSTRPGRFLAAQAVSAAAAMSVAELTRGESEAGLAPLTMKSPTDALSPGKRGGMGMGMGMAPPLSARLGPQSGGGIGSHRYAPAWRGPMTPAGNLLSVGGGNLKSTRAGSVAVDVQAMPSPTIQNVSMLHRLALLKQIELRRKASFEDLEGSAGRGLNSVLEEPDPDSGAEWNPDKPDPDDGTDGEVARPPAKEGEGGEGQTPPQPAESTSTAQGQPAVEQQSPHKLQPPPVKKKPKPSLELHVGDIQELQRSPSSADPTMQPIPTVVQRLHKANAVAVATRSGRLDVNGVMKIGNDRIEFEQGGSVSSSFIKGRNFVEVGPLGRGNCGSVVKALHLPSMKVVALKKVPLHQSDKYVARARSAGGDRIREAH
jgi:hypothetical protein